MNVFMLMAISAENNEYLKAFADIVLMKTSQVWLTLGIMPKI